MTNPLLIVDMALLSRVYIPVANWCGRRFGFTAGSLSRACIAPMLVFGWFERFGDWLIHPEYLVSILLSIPLQLFVATLFWFQSFRADQHPNPFTDDFWWLRIIWVTMFAAFSATALPWSLPTQLAILSVIYFRSVPNPPSKERRAPLGRTVGEAV